MATSHPRTYTWRLAHTEDVEAICQLLNVAYRGTAGWTNESQLMSGKRAHRDDILKDIAAPTGSYLLFFDPTDTAGTLIACIYVSQKLDTTYPAAYIGSFAVIPSLQACGMGKQILAEAEHYARQHFHAESYHMVVFTERTELIAYYERRGYVRTPEITALPTDINVGTPLKAVTLTHLHKPTQSTNKVK